ncbi:diguanylate cyclase [Rhizobium sp. Leaf383]|uniref:diguanylate cyclase n=1 Tax=Rhizobium sp. Leaf383 TaxID=1736357 RepID=UPI000712A840|nr:diguanylate cyclase [Rhizobium sp. Leaf383]KQS84812.1 diguanylate cyclase [Rhizobium sp. Leaf383]
MTTTVQTLVGNFACVALIISAWMHIGYRFYRLSKLQQQACLGLALGLAAVASMLMSIRFEQGIYLDLRLSLIIVSAIFGGPFSLLLTVVLTACVRIYMGGAGMPIGLLSILIGAAAATTTSMILRRSSRLHGMDIAAAAILSAVLSLAVLNMLPAQISDRATSELGVFIAVANFAVTAAAGLAMRYFGVFILERDILRAALTQAPDFHYVKDMEAKFVVTNLNVARHHGRSKSSEMVGLGDFDLEPEERARELFASEQAILQSGNPMVEFEERIDNGKDGVRWYSTSKVPLQSRQGDIVGLAGVTVDITERKRLAEELEHSRDIMSRAMAEMSDGLAMFDLNGVLVFCNEQYRALFPRSAYARVPGAHITDIVRAVARNGEREGLPVDASEETIRDLAATLHAAKDEFVRLCDDRWLSLRTRLGQDGSAMVVASDITLLKQSEEGLRRMALEMKDLAATDGLTGLPNRRAFDEAFAKETAAALETDAPLSLLLIDVDRFKAFNDTYGHGAGDDCLRMVASAIGGATKRKRDVAARYGGEEFCVLLPCTPPDTAVMIADIVRQAIRNLEIAHEGSEAGVVTVSIGVASASDRLAITNSVDLVGVADAALYRAKRLGRDRTEFGSSGASQQVG